MKIHVEFNSVSEMVNFSKFVGVDLTDPNLGREKEKELEWYKEAYEKTLANLERAYKRLRNIEDKVKARVEEERVLVMDFLPLSVRAMNCLQAENIYYMDELLEYTATELRKIPNFGKLSLKEVRDLLAQHNLKLKGD